MTCSKSSVGQQRRAVADNVSWSDLIKQSEMSFTGSSLPKLHITSSYKQN